MYGRKQPTCTTITKNKKEGEKSKKERADRQSYSGGFFYVQEQDNRILFISGLGFRGKYGIFYISD